MIDSIYHIGEESCQIAIQNLNAEEIITIAWMAVEWHVKASSFLQSPEMVSLNMRKTKQEYITIIVVSAMFLIP